MEQPTFDILSHPNFGDRAKVFYEKYDLVDIKGPGDQDFSKRALKRSSERSCRFCSLSYPATSFSNYSHLVPQLMGNRDMYSDFECDDCNNKFSFYENDLAEFLGISRSLSGLFGSGRPPGFAARRLSVKSRSFIGDNILIIAPEDLKREGSKTIISYTKNPFVPANVYRALLKSALSLLDNFEIKENYQHAIDYLAGKIAIREGANISGYSLSFLSNLPLHIYHFRKRMKKEKVPTDVMVFNFQNHIIALPIPLHQQDLKSNYKSYNIVIPPPYFVNKLTMDEAMPTSFMRDLSSTKRITDEEEHLTLTLDLESLGNAVIYNPEKHEFKKTETHALDIKYLILTKGEVTIDPKAFSAFMREQMEGS